MRLLTRSSKLCSMNCLNCAVSFTIFITSIFRLRLYRLDDGLAVVQPALRGPQHVVASNAKFAIGDLVIRSLTADVDHDAFKARRRRTWFRPRIRHAPERL